MLYMKINNKSKKYKKSKKYMKINKKSKKCKSKSGGALTEEQTQAIKDTVQKITLQKGSILYRTQPVKCTSIKCLYDDDTGKTGVYFSDSVNIPLGMILEYEKPMYICSYKTKEDIDFFVGKYSFRELEPNRFFKKYYASQKERDNKFIFNIDPENSYNHVDEGLFPLDDLFSGILREKANEKEYFIIQEDIDKIELMDHSEKKISYNEALKMVKTYKEILEDEYS